MNFLLSFLLSFPLSPPELNTFYHFKGSTYSVGVFDEFFKNRTESIRTWQICDLNKVGAKKCKVYYIEHIIRS